MDDNPEERSGKQSNRLPSKGSNDAEERRVVPEEARPLGPLPELAKRMGVRAPVDTSLWLRALTHSSETATGNFERLEFLGDRVLGLALAELLQEKFPDEDQGVLTTHLAGLADKPTAAAVGRSWALHPLLRVGGAIRGQGSLPESIVADSVEALLAVVYLEQGMAAIKPVVQKWWMPYVGISSGKDPKMELQELCMAHKRTPPEYVIVGMYGPDHQRVFIMSVTALGESAEGTAASKKEAEKEAARALLKLVDVAALATERKSVAPVGKDAKMELQEMCQAEHLSLPIYETVSTSGPDHNRTFTVSVRALGRRSTGTASTKKEAEKRAAAMLMKNMGKPGVVTAIDYTDVDGSDLIADFYTG